MDHVSERMFSELSEFGEADYLAFLSEHVPKDLSKQLTHDAHPELMLDDYIEIADLVKPLSSHTFMANADHNSNVAFRLVCVLGYTILGYAIDVKRNERRHDPCKQVYVASFYLYCCLHRAIRSREYGCALLVLVQAAAQMTLEGQFQVSRFLGSLIPILPNASVADPTPRSSALIALSMIVINTANDLSLLAERAIQEEDSVRAWEREESEESDPSRDALLALRQSVPAIYGPSGKIEQIETLFRQVGAPAIDS